MLVALVDAQREDAPPPECQDVIVALQGCLGDRGSHTSTSDDAPAEEGLTFGLFVDGDTPGSSDSSDDSAVQESDAVPVWHGVLELRPSNLMHRQGLDALWLLRDLQEICLQYTCTCVSQDLPHLAVLDPRDAHLFFRVEFSTSRPKPEVDEIFEFMDADSAWSLTVTHAAAAEVASNDNGQPEVDVEEATDKATTPAPLPTPTPKASTSTSGTRKTVKSKSKAGTEAARSVRVSIPKIDRLINVAGEVVIAQSMIKELVTNFSMERLDDLRRALADMERNTRELQERVMQVRMLPIATLIDRFPRMVREVALQLGKEVQLVIEGGETELDKTVIDLLGDPLMHILRNAVDHGLESPEAREAAENPERAPCG